MGEKKVVLSERLAMIARMVTPGNRTADVGCDHGFLAVYLVQAGISPQVIAMDVRKGPLSAAGEHVARWGLGAYIETRESDGLRKLQAGEVDTVVCAGMGGPLMQRILAESMEKAKLLKELILQPQSEIPEFRGYLRRAGFRVTAEDMVCEGGKYYFAMRAAPCQDRPDVTVDEAARYDKFGKLLLMGRHPVLEGYLRRQEAAAEGLVRELESSDTPKARMRLQEVAGELEDIRWALHFYDGKGR